MPFTKFVEIGRVVYISHGQDAGKIAAIVDIIDQNRALLDGPCTGVSRQARRFTELHLTGLVTKITRGASERSVRIAWTNDKISEKWSTTSWARRIEKRVKRASLTDLERFKVGKAKQARNKLIQRAFFSLKRKGTKSYETTRKRIEKLRSKSKGSKKSKPKA